MRSDLMVWNLLRFHTMRPKFRLLPLAAALLFVAQSMASASIVWTYDFPGTPGSPLGSGQTNPQTPNVTFGDWTRVNLSAVATSDVFDSNFWNITADFDSTQYASFTITADAGYHLNLSLLTFDQSRTSGGPTKGVIQIFLNGSATVYDSFSYNPTASIQNKTFSFIPTTDADNVTLIEFRWYGWNGGTPESSLIFDNVAISGIGVVPETGTIVPVALLLGCVVAESVRQRRRQVPTRA